jgi:signal transduction histidine kinase/CheY-like chemotaxis protein
MSDVSCRVFEFFEKAAVDHGFALAPFVAGISLSLDELRDPTRYCPWDDWAELCERLEARIGAAAVIAAGTAIPKDMGWNQGWRAVMKGAIRVPLLYEASLRWVSPMLFRHASFRVHALSEQHLHVQIGYPERYRGCPPWFRMAEGALRGSPRVLGLPDAAVSSHIGTHRATFDVHCPSGIGLGASLTRRVQAAWALGRVVDELAELQTDLRAAYSDLQRSEAELLELLQSLPQPMAIADHGGRLRFVNRSWTRAFGPPHATDTLASVLGGGELLGVDLLAAREHELDVATPSPTGTRRYAVAPAVEIVHHGVPAKVIQLRDVTAERAEEERIAVADRLTTLGTLAACVGHELVNPLGYATAALELLAAGLDRAPAELDLAALRQLAATVHDGLGQVAQIGRDLHAFSPRRGEAATAELRDVLQRALRLTEGQLRPVATATLHPVPHPLSVALEPGRLTQVFVNLLQNAAHALEELPRVAGHRVDVYVEREPEGQGPASSLDPTRVRVRVEDTGPGIPPGAIERIFEPFYSTKGARGTGLGLAVCRTIVEEAGGSITVCRASTGGAAFVLELPVVAPPRARDTPSPPDRPHRLRLLLVDDEPTLARLLPRTLRDHAVVVRRDPLAALEQLQRDQDFDAVLCDVAMPGMSGPELHERVGEFAPVLATRFVFLTGGATTPALAARLAAAGAPQLLKPFAREELLAAVWAVASARPTGT